jgi:gliding motility-associated-like protein
MSPDGKLYACDQANKIYLVDTLTGGSTLIFSLPPSPAMLGLVTLGGGIFYSMLEVSTNNADTLVEINVNTGVVTKLGVVPLSQSGDLTVYNGEIYYLHTFPNVNNVQYRGIVKLNINDPPASTLETTYPISYACLGVSATNSCHTLLGADLWTENQLILINLLDGAVTPLCDLPAQVLSITSMEEFSTPTICNSFDLDCNDSSGATDADFNALEVNCLNDHCAIADVDIEMLYESTILEMTIHLTGSLPDAPDEFIDIMGAIGGINISGSGTDLITLTNAGTATSTSFKNALLAVRYWNLASPFTPGDRTVEVQYTMESGAMSNVASTFISVVDLPIVQVDLGPDQTVCNGENVTLDAGYPGASYHWSNGLTTQSIITNQPGTYAVTVSTLVNCPGADSVDLDFIPVIHVSLQGDQEICIGENATLVIDTDSPFPLTIDITSSAGSTFTLTNVTDNFSFTDSPITGTLYSMILVTPSFPGCVELLDSLQFVDVFPTYTTFTDTSLCQGDSLWIGNNWVTNGGNYDYTYSTLNGCDSTVTTHVFFWPAIHISTQSTTCDSSLAGVFISYLDDPNGCDTVVEHTILLLPGDSTFLSLLTCNIASVDTTLQSLSNQAGCDSIIITTISWMPPADTTFLTQFTCDSAQLGVFQQILPGADGCDSLILTAILLSPPDTTFQFGHSCDSANIGIFINSFSNQSGCDSVVITTNTLALPDTTMLFLTSCDSASLGVFETHYTNQDGCDSLVIQTVTFSAQDSTLILGSTCVPSEAGTFIQSYTNTFGCDSIVTQVISLLPSGESFITSTTCDSTQDGTFLHTFINQYGCDSIVHETISLLPQSETFLQATSCKSSETGVFISVFQNQYGCDSVVTKTVSLLLPDTTNLLFKTCDPNLVGRIEKTFTSVAGCDSLVVEMTELFPLPALNVIVTSDFNGFDISCFGASDGSAAAQVVGTPLISYLWSNGGTDQFITGLSTVNYSVTITDGNGCMAEGEVELHQPDPFTIAFEITEPDCFDQSLGKITVFPIGGIGPYEYSIDGINFQSSSSFSSLNFGTYEVIARDANDCEDKEIVWINVPLAVHVELGEDRTLQIGDSTMIVALVNIPYDSLASISWTGLTNTNCPECLSQPVAPIITTTYSIVITNHDGCSDQDSMTLIVIEDIDLYVPNIFSPNGDHVNDEVGINSANNDVQIDLFQIFDRWGNMVHSASNFMTGDPSAAWDGLWNGSALNPGVYTYLLRIHQENPGQPGPSFKYGNITLVK